MQQGRMGCKLAEDLFTQIIGKQARNIQLGHGSFVTMDFGKDVVLKEKVHGEQKFYIQGEWHLWIYMCAWRLDKANQPLIGAADDRDLLQIHLKTLETKTILAASIANTAFDVVLTFEDAFVLRLFSFGILDHEQWMLFTPNRKVFTAGPGTTWSYEDSSLSTQTQTE